MLIYKPQLAKMPVYFYLFSLFGLLLSNFLYVTNVFFFFEDWGIFFSAVKVVDMTSEIAQK